MSSCFLCDTSYILNNSADRYYVHYSDSEREQHYIKTMPIMVGSTGLGKYETGFDYIKGDDQQHNNNNKQNYVSYRVEKIEFRASLSEYTSTMYDRSEFPDYIILFKIPFRDPVFNPYFDYMKDFILYANPECVLSYGVYDPNTTSKEGQTLKRHGHAEYNLNVNKPFIVGPNDYVGVLYFFYHRTIITSSAKVWFDIL